MIGSFALWDNCTVDPTLTRRQIIRKLQQNYSCEDLGESVFVHRIGYPRTFCLEFFTTYKDSGLKQVIEIRDDSGQNSDRTVFEADCMSFEDDDDCYDEFDEEDCQCKN